MTRVVLIAGPTASGKSALALMLAERLHGAIINADSMQVYRDLRIITARPSAEEEQRLPHFLYGHVDAAVNYSVGQYMADAARALKAVERMGRLPIFVGGTGLYFKALTHGLAAVPAIPPQIREAVRARLAAEGAPALHAELALHDAVTAARLNRNDRIRIARALEVVLATGRSLSAWHREGLPPVVEAAEAVKVFLAPERGELYRRINARFDAMLRQGAIEEVRMLAARRLDPLLPAMKAHGVPWLLRTLRGEIPLEEAAHRAKRDTRHYAKRQFTWFRHQLRDFVFLPPTEAFARIMQMLEG